MNNSSLSPEESIRLLDGSKSNTSTRLMNLAQPKGRNTNFIMTSNNTPENRSMISVEDPTPGKFFIIFSFHIFLIFPIGPNQYQDPSSPLVKRQNNNSTKKNFPSFSIMKSKQNAKMVITSMHTVDNLGMDSPGVGNYDINSD